MKKKPIWYLVDSESIDDVDDYFAKGNQEQIKNYLWNRVKQGDLGGYELMGEKAFKALNNPEPEKDSLLVMNFYNFKSQDLVKKALADLLVQLDLHYMEVYRASFEESVKNEFQIRIEIKIDFIKPQISKAYKKTISEIVMDAIPNPSHYLSIFTDINNYEITKEEIYY